MYKAQYLSILHQFGQEAYSWGIIHFAVVSVIYTVLPLEKYVIVSYLFKNVTFRIERGNVHLGINKSPLIESSLVQANE